MGNVLKILAIFSFLIGYSAMAEGLVDACRDIITQKGLASSQTVSYCVNAFGGANESSTFSMTDYQCVEYAKQQGVSEEKANIFCKGAMAAVNLYSSASVPKGYVEDVGVESNRFLNPEQTTTQNFFDYYYNDHYLYSPLKFSFSEPGKIATDPFDFSSETELFDETSVNTPKPNIQDPEPKKVGYQLDKDLELPVDSEIDKTFLDSKVSPTLPF